MSSRSSVAVSRTVVSAVLVTLIALVAPSVQSARASASEITSAEYEFGSVSLTTSWTRVTLRNSYVDPVVVLGAPSASGIDPVTMRVRNVDGGGFEARLEEWTYLDGVHLAETAAFAVMERGPHTIGGLSWEAGYVDGVGNSSVTVPFSSNGRGTGQTVLAQVVTANGAGPVVPRAHSVSATFFSVALQKERVISAPSSPERVAYLAVQRGIDSDGPVKFWSGRRTFTGESTYFYGSTLALPSAGVFAQITDLADPNAANIRTVIADETSMQLALQEEASTGDSTHAAEDVRFLVVGDLVSYAAPPPPGGGNCPEPPTDVVVQPGQSVQVAVDAAPGGTAFLLAAGTHHLQRVSPKAGDQFYGALDGNCNRLTTLDGSRAVTGWAPSGDDWKAAGMTQQGHVLEGLTQNECEAGWRCLPPEDLFLDGVPLHHVLSRAEVVYGTWFFDYPNDAVYLGDNPAGHVVELSETPEAFDDTAPNVTVYGLRIQKYATTIQVGAIGGQFPPPDWTVEFNEIAWSHGSGIGVGDFAVVRDNFVHNNGEVGINSHASGAVIEGNEISYNNYAHIRMSFESGGIKLKSVSDITVNGNNVHDNYGPGIWSDVGSSGVVYEGNTIYRNAKEGIIHEISYDAVIRNNIIGHNGRIGGWLYGSQILISTSKDVEVYGNTVEVDVTWGNAISVIWQNRGGDHQAMGNVIHDNDITFLAARGQNGGGYDWSGGSTIYDQNRFYGNHYHMPSLAFKHFKWSGGNLSRDGWKQRGQDVAGTFDTNIVARSWL